MSLNPIEQSVKDIRDDLLHHQKEDMKSFGNIERLLESNTDILKRHDTEFAEMKGMIQSIANDSKPMILWFQNITFGKRVAIGIMGIVATLVGIVWGVKQILTK